MVETGSIGADGPERRDQHNGAVSCRRFSAFLFSPVCGWFGKLKVSHKYATLLDSSAHLLGFLCRSFCFSFKMEASETE